MTKKTKITAGRLLGSRELFHGEDVFIDLEFGDAIPTLEELDVASSPAEGRWSVDLRDADVAERVGWFLAEQLYDRGFDGKLRLKLYRPGAIGGALYEAKFVHREGGLRAVSEPGPVAA